MVAEKKSTIKIPKQSNGVPSPTGGNGEGGGKKKDGIKQNAETLN